MDTDFFLETHTAKKLYHGAAAGEPIYDFHCHLNPADIAANRKFENLAEAWLGGDHYKWRQMRTAGIAEKYITGNAAPYEKFLAWARTVEDLIGNPLYHWSHLELQRYFNIYEPLTEKSAPTIWKKANARLDSDELSVRGIFDRMNVYAVGTTDDPADSLESHRAIASGNAPIGTIATRVIPSFRPDRALGIDLAGFPAYIARLAGASGIGIASSDDVIDALERRLDFFAASGCRAADHGLNYPPFKIMDDAAIDRAFRASLAGEAVTVDEADAYKTKILAALGKAYAKRGIVMQLHMSVTRNNNPKAFATIGPDAGHDAANDNQVIGNVAGLLGLIENSGGLPKTILFTLNPKDYYPLATLMGCYQGPSSEREAGIPGKVQLGAAWWFCDHRDGMVGQMTALANLGMLPTFVGMLTDSRSFLSYARHEYFRRVMCNLIGTWVENGEYPADEAKLESIVRDIAFRNASAYFG
jgi:glucuronate isomerase